MSHVEGNPEVNIMPGTVPIPQPAGYPFIGNATEIDAEIPLKTFTRWAEIHGPIYRFSVAGYSRVVISSQALMNEISDETRFTKAVSAALEQVRNGIHDGLFTAYGPEEKSWGIAHRILMPAFGPLSIQGMFDEMYDIASQLVMKWARHGPNNVIAVTDDFTRLTLDTIALCAMDYRFNSYYHEAMHPFVGAMSSFLVESGHRATRPGIVQMFYRGEEKKYWDNIELLRKTASEVIKTRRANPTDRKDLLNAMLNGVDPKTGEKMSDENIMDNMITFLIAGHETTSGLLSFVMYHLTKNPAAYARAQQEVDEVVGKEPLQVKHLSRLPYLNAILRETLRLTPTAPIYVLKAKEDTVLGGKYSVAKGESIVANLPTIQRDPLVYGDDAEQWRPERLLDAEFDRLQREYPGCWKPFGNGIRGCIGRPFATQEALLVLVVLLQNFNFTMDDPLYVLQLKQTLTIKPKDFYIRARLRNKVTPTLLERFLRSGPDPASPLSTKSTGSFLKAATKSEGTAKGKQIAIYYGSNTGTCEALASRLAGDAANHGFQASCVDILDAAKESLPTDGPVFIVTASYEGQPPDNAAHFVNWLQGLDGSELEKVSFAVFGCGHHDWAQTFHRIPKLLDQLLAERGAKRLAPLGKTDAAAGNMFTDFEFWEDNVFWPAMVKEYGTTQTPNGTAHEAGLKVEVSSPRSSALRQDVKEARVVDAKSLTAPGAPEKRHVEISLPSDMSYSAGDYLAILPLNPKENVQRAMRYFGLAWDSMLTIAASGPTSLPTNTPISATDVFQAYVELAQPASNRNVIALLEATQDEATKTELKRLANSAFHEEISAKRISILDLLERFPSVSLPIGPFLQMQPPMRVRQYSISSSPLWNPSHVTLTYSILEQPAFSGHGKFVGVASNYLSTLQPGDHLHVSVRPSQRKFHLPKDVENVPVIMIAAGTGIAPFRAFIQERAALVSAGRNLAPALLFYGCRAPATDALYSDLLKRWQDLGAVDVRHAYSKATEESHGCKHVQHRLWHDREDAIELFDKGAKVFICGSGEVGEGVRATCRRIVAESDRAKAIDDESEVDAWWDKIVQERFATDVFA